jgi:O-antigen/teichoic acid export membrane protein
MSSTTETSAVLEADATTSLGEPHPSQLSGHVVRGLGWKLVSQIAIQGTRLAVGITLARLLTPHQFGLAAMALVITAFVVPFADMGLGSALVQRPTIDETDRSTVFWASVGAGVGLSLLGFALSPLIADFYGDDAVAPLVAVLCLSFAITSLGATQRSLLARAMNFRSLELRTVAGTVAGGVGAVVVAAMGYGAWAFITNEIVLALVSTVLLWSLVPWRPQFRFGRRNFRELSGYGGRVLGGASFTNLSRNADNLLIGRYIGAHALGLYAFAYNLMLASLMRIVAPLQQVIFPALSRIQHDRRRLASSWIRGTRLIAATSGPILAGVLVTAPDLVPLVFGEKWKDAVPIVQLLCIAGISQCAVALNDTALKAVNRVKLFLRFSGVAFAVNLAAFVLGLHWGVNGVAAAFAIASAVLGVAYTVLMARAMEMSLREIASGLRGVALAVAGMALCAAATRALLLSIDIPAVVRLVITVEVAVAIYFWLLRVLAPEVIDDLRTMLRARGRAPEAAAAVT